LLSLAARSRLKVLTAGHECKHNACRAEVGGCVSGYTYIRRIGTAPSASAVFLQAISVLAVLACISQM